ncbi:MAG: hypothetical protein AAGC95_08805 [Pseudomonadota bacterium]
MPMKFKTDKELLEFVAKGGVSRAHAQGYFWFWRKFIPALEKAKASSLVSNEMVADCYYVAGDVHDFNEAPKAAIKCYRNALRADPNCGGAYREIANMLGRMGRYDDALAHSDSALSINPDDQYALSDREDYIGESRLEPSYIEGNAEWIASEYLARAKPRKTLKALRKVKGIRSLRAKAHCYGAMEQSKKYLEAWAEIAKRSDEIRLTYSDWFFMEDAIYDEPGFWEVLLSSKAKFSGVFFRFRWVG